MADRMQFQAPSIFATTTPQVLVDDGTADYLKNQSTVFLNNANEAHKRQLRSDLDLAQKEGERVGYNAAEKFKPMKAGSLFAKQFNESGLFNAEQKISMNTQKKIKELAAKNAANPTGLATSLEGWREGYIGDLPDELQTPFQKNFDVISDAAIENAKAQRKTLDGQIAAANHYQYEREVTNTVEEIAPLSFRQGPEGDAARAALATVRQNYVESLSGNGPEGEYEVGGYKIKGAAGRSGAFTPLEIAKKITAFDNGIISAGIMGNFQEEVENGRGIEAYMQVAKGDMEISTVDKDGKLSSVKVSDVLTNDEMDKITTDMRSFIGGVRSIEEGEFKKYERGREYYNDSLVEKAYKKAFQVTTDTAGNTTVLGGDPVALQNIIGAALKDPMVKPETIDKLQKLANDLGSGDIDNPVTVGNIWQGISQGELTSYKSLPTFGISDTTRIKMYDAIDQRNKGQHWTNSNRYAIAQDYADAVLAPAKSAGFSLLGDPNSESAADRAEWNKRMIEDVLSAEVAGTLPQNMNGRPADGEYDFVSRGKEIADDIAARRKTPPDPAMVEIDTQIKEVQAQMDNPKPTDDPKAVAERFRKLQDQKAQLQSRKAMGIGQ